MDSTSLSVEGEYEKVDEAEVLKLTYGYSKDNRPDLKQAVMSLVVSGSASIPLWMEPRNGNSSDKATFHETIKKVRAFQAQLKGCPDFKWVADSALYTQEGLLNQNDYLWLSRVPETIKEAKALTEKAEAEITWVEGEHGYKTASFTSNYGNIPQRWLLVYSEQAYQREKAIFSKKLLKQEALFKKAVWHLENQIFNCELDAKKALQTLVKQFKYHLIDFVMEPVKKHKKAGRPKEGVEEDIVGYRVTCSIQPNPSVIEIYLNRKGRFILATNDLDEAKFSGQKMLSEYKAQQSVEQGFRFLKDPWFMVDSIFLKSPKRIAALMMIMTLCLMVYNIGQYRLRSTLKEKNETVPNQINKPIQNPTLRWIFQIMEGIGIIRFYEKNTLPPIKEFITNLDVLRIKIINCFGLSAKQIYGIP